MPEKGFSLVEVIISIFLAALLITGLFLSYKASWDMVAESSEIAVARTAATSKLEELRAYTPSQIRNYNGTNFSVTLSNGEIMRGTITVSSSDPPIVTITMNWGDTSSLKSITIAEMLYRPVYEVE